MSTSPLKADSRAKFEACFCKKKNINISQVIACRAGDSYWDDARCLTSGIQQAWEFWQASRAAIVVNLPSLKQSDTGDRYQWSDGVFHFKHDTADILRAAGITVKGDSDEANANAS